MTENRKRRSQPPSTPPTNKSRARPAGNAPWPLPQTDDESKVAREGLAWSSLAGNSTLGLAALGVGAGAFRRKYRSSKP
jgi:hypothetical protein